MRFRRRERPSGEEGARSRSRIPTPIPIAVRGAATAASPRGGISACPLKKGLTRKTSMDGFSFSVGGSKVCGSVQPCGPFSCFPVVMMPSVGRGSAGRAEMNGSRNRMKRIGLSMRNHSRSRMQSGEHLPSTKGNAFPAAAWMARQRTRSAAGPIVTPGRTSERDLTRIPSDVIYLLRHGEHMLPKGLIA